jgi:predicted alpha/beta-hydrolase family hydrolase
MGESPRRGEHRGLHAQLSATTLFVALSFCAFSIVLPVGSVAALYSSGGSGPSTTEAQSVPASAAPQAVVSLRDVTVTWQATTMSGGTPAAAYTVRRYNAGGVAQVVNNACVTVTTNSCVEHLVPDGTWQYSVQAVQGSWTGAESSKGAAVTVNAASMVITSAQPITALPSTVTATFANFLPGESLTYRLDSTSGTLLTGTPTTSGGGSGTASITLLAGTTDAPHSIVIMGSGGTIVFASVAISMPPKLVSMQMKDINGNGKVDQVVVNFDDTLAAYTAGTAPWTLANVPSGGVLSSVTVSGSTATLMLTEGAGAANTAVGTFTVALATNSAGVRDVNNHLSSFAATTPADAAPPVLVSNTMNDTNANGRVDQVAMVFSEALAAYTAGTAPWTLTNVPSGGVLSTVTVATPNVTLAITEGAGAPDTSVGSFTVGLATNAAGVRDAAGNLASFTTSPTDGAKPIRQTLEMFDDNGDGKIDRLYATFSEPLASYSAGTTPWVLTSAPSAATVASATTSGSAVTIQLNQGAGAANTAVGSFTVAMSANAAGVRDASGNQATFTATAPTDRAAPALVTLSLLDATSNGKVDRVTAVFSETLSAYSAGVTPWTLANMPSGGTLSSVAVATTTATLTLTEGAGAADTSVGAMTVAMASSATGVRDAAGNLGSFAARTPLDKAKPAVASVVDTNGANDGKFEPGDSLSITFTEPMAPAGVPALATVTLTDPVGTGNDTLTISGITNTARSLGANNYMVPDQGVAAWANSPVTLSADQKTVTVVVGPTCAGTGCTGLGQQLTNANFSFVAAATLVDPSGNVPLTSAKTTSMRVF